MICNCFKICRWEASGSGKIGEDVLLGRFLTRGRLGGTSSERRRSRCLYLISINFLLVMKHRISMVIEFRRG